MDSSIACASTNLFCPPPRLAARSCLMASRARFKAIAVTQRGKLSLLRGPFSVPIRRKTSTYAIWIMSSASTNRRSHAGILLTECREAAAASPSGINAVQLGRRRLPVPLVRRVHLSRPRDASTLPTKYASAKTRNQLATSIAAQNQLSRVT